MKNILLFVCLVAFGNIATAQNGALKIVNTSSTCAVTVTMYAQAPSMGGSGNCAELISNTFVVPAGITRNFPTRMNFTGIVGWSYTPAPMTVGVTDFQWTSAYFTSSCVPSCSPTASWNTIADSYACQGANLLCGDGCATLDWVSPFAGSALADVVINVY